MGNFTTGSGWKVLGGANMPRRCPFGTQMACLGRSCGLWNHKKKACALLALVQLVDEEASK